MKFMIPDYIKMISINKIGSGFIEGDNFGISEIPLIHEISKINEERIITILKE